MAGTTIISWNVNGIRAAVKKGFLSFLEACGADVLCIQETKAHVDQLPRALVRPHGYSAYFASAQRKGYSGVATYTRREPNEVIYGLGRDEFDSEGRTLITRFGNVLLYNIYFPNGKAGPERLRYKMDFYEAFLEHANSERARGRSIIVCGDFNTAHREMDLARPKENENTSGFLPMEREWIDRFIASGYTDTFRYLHPHSVEYSWWDYKTRARERNVGWRIDYFFVSNDLRERVREAYIMGHVMGSDHCPIALVMDPGL